MKTIIDKLRRWQLELRRFIQNGQMKEKDWIELYELRKHEKR